MVSFNKKIKFSGDNIMYFERQVDEKGIHSFNNSLKLGNIGEDRIEYFMKRNYDVKSIVNVSDNPLYQQEDVDFIVNLNNGSSLKVEVKTDTYDVNFYYELISNMDYNTPGCMVKTKADKILYYFINLGVAYIIDRVDYQKWFKEHEFDKKIGDYGIEVPVMITKYPYNYYDSSKTRKYKSKGKVFPITFFEETFKGEYKKDFYIENK